MVGHGVRVLELSAHVVLLDLAGCKTIVDGVATNQHVMKFSVVHRALQVREDTFEKALSRASLLRDLTVGDTSWTREGLPSSSSSCGPTRLWSVLPSTLPFSPKRLFSAH
jgi:hypothetical protein